MKSFMSILLIAYIAFFMSIMSVSKARALELGINITVFDNQKSESYKSTQDTMGYDGIGVGKEDQETEPKTLRSEMWDLEAFYLNGTVLSMVGQWDFLNGEKMVHDWERTYYDQDNDGYYTSGDVFIDIDPSNNTYEYVFDVDWKNKSYALYFINSGVLISTSYKSDSSPWKIDVENSNLTQISSGAFQWGVDNNLGFYGTVTDHRYVTGFDLQPILNRLGVNKIEIGAHFTMECGNDNLMGSGTAPVPEPSTILLVGSGLALFGVMGSRKVRNKKV